MNKKTFVVMVLFLLLPGALKPCTTAIVSGRATPDGRPLLWKHRDSGFEQNVIRYFTDGRYRYMALVNASDTLGLEVWAGVNEAGFAIMNSASYNLKSPDDSTKLKDREGKLMKLALRFCKTLADFETLLDTLPKPLGVESNFGVIDAHGGAAYYETDNFHFTKLDVNDPRLAPNGYLIHTNYSFTGRLNKGYGYIRYQMAEQLFNQALATNALTPQFILQKVSRCLKHGLTAVDLTQSPQNFVPFIDYIPRKSSVASIVVKGVASEENPAKSVMWTVLGFPLTTVALPLWVANMENLPAILLPGKDHLAPLCKAGLQLKERCFPIQRGSGPYYLNLPVVWNAKGTGITQKILKWEKVIFEQNALLENQWPLSKKQLAKFYQGLEKEVQSFYQSAFNVMVK